MDKSLNLNKTGIFLRDVSSAKAILNDMGFKVANIIKVPFTPPVMKPGLPLDLYVTEDNEVIYMIPAKADIGVVDTSSTMSIEEENKALVRRYYELMNRGDFDGLSELHAPGKVSHYTTGDVLEEQKSWSAFYSAFPDISFTVEHMVAEGDKVAFQETVIGTHKGEFMGIAPTGNKVETINTCIIRIADGKFAESWCTLDEYNLMKQLGLPSL